MPAWVPAVVFAFGMAAAVGFERRWPLGPKGTRERLRTNLQLLAVVMAVGWLVGFTMAYFAIFCAEKKIGILNALPLEPWVKTLGGLLLFDLGDYARHRVFHKVPWVWRFHHVHHSDEVLDCTSAFRNHPMENLLQGVFHCCVIAACGIPLSTLLLRTPLLFAALIFQHANVAVRGDEWIAWLTPSPRQHRVHHSPHQPHTDSNFGVLLTLWDRLLGTYVYPSEEDSLQVGLDEVLQTNGLSRRK